MQTIKERKQELEESLGNGRVGAKLEKGYENGDVAVYLTRNGTPSYPNIITYTSSAHWTGEVATLRHDNDGNISVSYSSGGIVDCEPEQVAEAMKEIFKDVEDQIADLKS